MSAISNNISSSVIENYIQRVTELSQSSQRIPTTEELETIAAELGIEPEEIQAAQKQSNDHYIRAQGYMGLKHWDDAIAELQEAVAFNPSNLEMLLGLAKAHMGRWQEKHHREDETNIRFRIRQCLAIKPDSQEALSLLARLSNSLKWYKRSLIATALSLGGLAIGIGGVIWLGNGLPDLFQRESKLEQLEQRVMGQIAELRQEQEALKIEIMTFQANNEELNQSNLRRLQNDIDQLEENLTQLEKKVIETEEKKPSKSVPNYPIISPPIIDNPSN